MKIKILVFLLPLLAAAVQARPLNVLLITGDDHGVEMDAYGDDQAHTPNLNQLGEMGVLFERGYVTQSSCSPSRSSILTGLYPHQNGQLGLAHVGYAINPELPNLAAEMKNAGYMTGIIGKLHVEPVRAFPFDLDNSKFVLGSRDVAEVSRRADAFMGEAEKAGLPFFLYVNFFDPHRPYDEGAFQTKGIPSRPHTAEEVELLPFVALDFPGMRHDVAGYYSALERVDWGVGLLIEDLKRRNLLDDTLIIYVGDHGAPFARAKTTCYEAGVRVPFLVYVPGALANGSRDARFVSTVDIMPTILEAAGLEVPPGLAGCSLLPLLENDANPQWRTMIATEYTAHRVDHYYPRRAIRDGRYKLILNLESGRKNPAVPGQYKAPPEGDPWRAVMEVFLNPPRYELYDVEADPYELHNLSGDPAYADTLRKMQEELHAWRQETNDPTLDLEYLKRLGAQHAKLAGGKWVPLEEPEASSL